MPDSVPSTLGAADFDKAGDRNCGLAAKDDVEREAKARERSEARASQIGSGSRSEKIRTYNFKESRVTDHRIKLTVHNLPEVLDGQLDDITDALKQDEIRHRLENL